MAISARGDVRYSQHLVEIAHAESDDHLRSDVYLAIGKLGDENALSFLRQRAREDPDFTDRVCAAVAAYLISGSPEQYAGKNGTRLIAVYGPMYDGISKKVESLQQARREFGLTGHQQVYDNPVTNRVCTYRGFLHSFYRLPLMRVEGSSRAEGVP